MPTLTFGNIIGAGGYGSVFHGHWGTRRVAIKKFNVTQADAEEEDSIWREIQLLERLRDKHIILFYGSTYHEDKLVLIMEYAEGGSLQGAIKKNLLDWPAKTRIAQGIAQGLAYIHEEGIIHRDLKSLNVLLTQHMEVKLCDFGLATVKTTSASNSKGDSILKGTLRWMAPELFVRRPKYTTKSDIYALGMVMWEMAANCTIPFKETLDREMVALLIAKGEREDLPNDTPADYRKCVERCWEQDPAMRPEASEILIKNDVLEHEDTAGGDMSTVSITEDVSGLKVLSPLGKGTGLKSDSTVTTAENRASLFLLQSDAVQHPFSLLVGRAEEGNVEAQVALAEKYYDGDGVEQSDVNAFKWYFQAAKLGNARANFGIKLMMFSRRCTRQNYSEALSWYRSLADQGNADGQFDLGWMCENGTGVEQNYTEAVLWYRIAAEQGNANAQCQLGTMYANGWGVDQSDTEAASWYRKSAEQGNAIAQFSLGRMYATGRGVEQSDTEAASWYSRSVVQRNAYEQLILDRIS